MPGLGEAYGSSFLIYFMITRVIPPMKIMGQTPRILLLCENVVIPFHVHL